MYEVVGGSNNVCEAAPHTLHAGTLAENDNDYLSRISVAAAQMKAGYLAAAVLGHQIRDEWDLNAHIDYIHINPVKHSYVSHVVD